MNKPLKCSSGDDKPPRLSYGGNTDISMAPKRITIVAT